MKSIALAYQAILLGESNCVLAGGTESMSRLPYYLDGARWGYRLGNQELVDGMYRDGFFCPLAKMVMGETAEVLAEQYKITRDEQDEFALTSQTRAARAIAAGRLDAEIVPVTIEGKKGNHDLRPRRAPVPRCESGKARQTTPGFLEDRNHLRGKFFGHHRRRCGHGHRQRVLREAEQSQAAGSHRRR